MSEQVYQILKEQIIKGYYYEGQKLTETGIAKVLEVSPTPVREAFKRLESEGFIVNVAYKGAFVKSYSKDEVICAYHMRAKIQGIALRFMMDKLDEDSIEAFKKIFEAAENNGEDHILKRYIPVHNWMIFGVKMDIVVEALTTINAIINFDRLVHALGEIDETLVKENFRILANHIIQKNTEEAVIHLEKMIIYVLNLYLEKEGKNGKSQVSNW